jgi:hypothetical protein
MVKNDVLFADWGRSMKKLLLALTAVVLTLPAYASSTLYTNSTSVGVGTSAPTTGAALDLSYNANSMLLPVGTTGDRPGTGVNGMMRYNSTLGAIEGYISGAWASIGSGSSGFSSCTIVSVTGCISAGSCTASCAGGYTMTGGGGSCSSNLHPLQNSFPSASNSWEVDCTSNSSSATAYAICCH